MQNQMHTKSAATRVAIVLAALAVFATAGAANPRADSPAIETQENAETLLLVRTTPAGAVIQLNGQPIGSSGELLPVEPGKYKLVVDMTGHKPHKQQITIEDGRITRIELTLDKVATRGTSAQFVNRKTLKYDDDKADGKRSLGGSGEMIRFSLPEGKWKAKGIQLHGSRYGYPQAPNEDFLVYFLNKDRSEVVATEEAPYRLFRRGNPKWVRIRFKEPVDVPDDFWVCVNFNAERTKGVYVSYDTSSGGVNSKIGLPGMDDKNVDFGGDWMIRVELVPADQAKSTTSRTTLKHDDGKVDGKRSIAGAAQMVKFSLPEGEWKVRGIQLHGSRYGYPQAPKENFKIYFLNEDLSKVVATERAPYRLFNRGNPRWVRIRFKKPVEVPRAFWVGVNFNAEQTKGVYVSYDTSTGGEYSKIGRPEGEKKSVNFGGDWMIRVDLVSTRKKSNQRADARGIPNIMSTSPKVGASDVDPSLSEITVTFDRDMSPDYSWTGGGPHFPKGVEGKEPHWRDKRTCVFPCKLEAGQYYRIGINSTSHQNFKSAAGVSAASSEIYFTTKGATADAKARTKKPRTVKMNPPNGATDVNPNLSMIRIEFNRAMDRGFSWTGGGPHFPEIPKGKKPRWSQNRKTCYLPVRLKPGWDYRLGLNSPSHKNFKSRAGVALDPVVYRFRTRNQ